MVFTVGQDGKLRRELEINSPEIYRMTPYEFALTAEPTQQIVQCVQQVQVSPSSIPMGIPSRIRSVPPPTRGGY